MLASQLVRGDNLVKHVHRRQRCGGTLHWKHYQRLRLRKHRGPQTISAVCLPRPTRQSVTLWGVPVGTVQDTRYMNLVSAACYYYLLQRTDMSVILQKEFFWFSQTV